MFSECNQFLPPGSNLNTTRCIKSQRGLQIHANPSPLQPITGGGSVRAHKHRLHTNTLPGHKAAPGVTAGALRVRPSDFDLVLTWCGTICKWCNGEEVGALFDGVLQRYLSHRSCCREDNEHHFHSAHATHFPSCVDFSRKIKSSTVKRLSCKLFFQSMLSAAGDTGWWKPQEACELTETAFRERSTVSAPPAHHINRQQHHFLWMTESHSVNALSLRNELQAFNLFIPNSQEREGAMSVGDIWWLHYPHAPFAHTHKYTVTPPHTTKVVQPGTFSSVNWRCVWLYQVSNWRWIDGIRQGSHLSPRTVVK